MKDNMKKNLIEQLEMILDEVKNNDEISKNDVINMMINLLQQLEKIDDNYNEYWDEINKCLKHLRHYRYEICWTSNDTIFEYPYFQTKIFSDRMELTSGQSQVIC